MMLAGHSLQAWATHVVKCGITGTQNMDLCPPDFAQGQRKDTKHDVKRNLIAEMSTQTQQGSNIFHSKQK